MRPRKLEIPGLLHAFVLPPSRSMEPITFKPLFKERVWGGRALERVYGHVLPKENIPYGESWEIVDRDGDQSVVDAGPLTGATLHDLWYQRREEIFGCGLPDSARFPILVKVLDARDDLSIQVHPPVHLAESLGGEPKTEMWYIAGADKGAKLYAGLKRGVDRAEFERAIAQGTVGDCVHSITPKAGDSIFIPSGRLHAIGAGLLIHEIQQNSDTTYRVFDWNRLGLDGKPRELHINPSLASIDFDDCEPGMDDPRGTTLASCPWFSTDRIVLSSGERFDAGATEHFRLLAVVDGELESTTGRRFSPGSFLLLPRGCEPLRALENSTVLVISLPMNA